MGEVALKSLTKVFDEKVTAIDALDLDIRDGEFFALLGPSGCGKTTLLRMIAGLEAPSEGSIVIDGEDVTKFPPGRRDIAMVFQDYELYPHMTVVDNIAYPLKVRKVAREERHRAAEDAAESLALEGLLERRPGQLSGGQQQRVAVARAIAHRPRVFLFDEPLSNLDARLRLEARTFLKRLQKDVGVTTVYVTHDQSEALALADRIAVMEDGRVRQLGTPPEIYHRPNSVFVAGFIGSVPMNLLPAVVAGDRLRIGRFQVQLPASARGSVSDGDEVTLGARPEYAALATEEVPDAVEATVSVVELLGNDHLATVEDGDLTVQATVEAAPQLGDRAWVLFDPDHALLYRRDDGSLIGPSAEGDDRSPATGPHDRTVVGGRAAAP